MHEENEEYACSKLADIDDTLHAILEKLSEIQRTLVDKDRFTG